MKKIALISDGWKRLITYAWVDGIMNRIRELGADIALYQFHCYGNWSRDAKYNMGEYNIYNLPDLASFDGIVLDCSNITDEAQREKTVEKLRESGVPVVTIDRAVDDFYYVGADNQAPIREVVKHLYEVHGCRRFVFAGGPADSFSNQRRATAYSESLSALGLSVEDNPVLSGDFDYNTGVRYLQEFVREGRAFPDAFVCANDNIAAGICAEAENHGYRVPDDFRVTGFDNLDKAAYFRPQITTGFQDRSGIGATCVDVLTQLWDGVEVPRYTYVPSQCIYGESCGCPNSGQVDYREYIRNQIVHREKKDADDVLLLELEAQMARQTSFEGIFSCVEEFFDKLHCDGMYIVVDRRLFEADAQTVFPTEGYNWENLMVAVGIEDHVHSVITDAGDLMAHLTQTGSGNAYLFTPIHFRDQAVGYMIMKNGRFLYDNPHYYDIHSAIVSALETRFKHNQLENAAQKLQDLYNRDPLTGIYNRIAYTDMICPAFDRYSEQGIVCALAFVDADNFKQVNDTYGHEFGDHVLIRIAHVMQEECPEGGYVCRYGGDEFIVFFPHATPAKTHAYRERVQKRLAAEQIAISMGVKLMMGAKGEGLDHYLSLADENMYRLKQERKKGIDKRAR